MDQSTLCFTSLPKLALLAFCRSFPMFAVEVSRRTFEYRESCLGNAAPFAAAPAPTVMPEAAAGTLAVKPAEMDPESDFVATAFFHCFFFWLTCLNCI